jgi:hypothetical protein
MRIVGPVFIVAGFAMFVAGVISFHTRFNEEREEFDLNFGNFGRQRVKVDKSPDRFWMCFAGVPIAIAGVWLTRLGYVGATARYVAGETAPVARDTVNYVLEGTKESIREVASAVRGARDRDRDNEVDCPKCGHGNDADANFCDECGAALARACTKCGKNNDADAKFCDACGTPVE